MFRVAIAIATILAVVPIGAAAAQTYDKDPRVVPLVLPDPETADDETDDQQSQGEAESEDAEDSSEAAAALRCGEGKGIKDADAKPLCSK